MKVFNRLRSKMGHIRGGKVSELLVGAEFHNYILPQESQNLLGQDLSLDWIPDPGHMDPGEGRGTPLKLNPVPF